MCDSVSDVVRDTFPTLHFLQNRTLDLATADKFNVIFCYLVCTLFGLSTGSLFIFHIYLSLFNRTTLGRTRISSTKIVKLLMLSLHFNAENMQWPRTVEGTERRLYFLGFKANLRQVFGRNCFLALLPVASM